MINKEIRAPGFVVYSGYDRDLAKESVGNGWSPLIDKIFDKMEELNSAVKIVQVKEKWGGLRIYTDYSNEDIDEFIRDVEIESFTICETCGKPGKLRDGGWYMTLCDEHANGREPVEPF